MCRTRGFALAGLTFVFCVCAGCAFMEKDNRRLLTAMDEGLKDTFVTDTSAGQIAAAPLMVPIANCALVADVFVIHPVCMVPEAAEKTYEALWENPSGSPFRQMIILPPKAVATPLIFTAAWFALSAFDD